MKIDSKVYTEEEIIELLRTQQSEIRYLTKKIQERKILNTDAMTQHDFNTYLWDMPIWLESIYKIYEFFMEKSDDEQEKMIVWIEYRAFFNFLKHITGREEITEKAFGKNDE